MEMEQLQRKNQRIHIQALALTKLGDGLVDPKIVLSWLLTSLGAGAGFVGLLVPLREAGALLPQLFTAARLRKVSVRKWWWVFGSLVQGMAVLSIALAAYLLEGDTAGLVIVGLIAIFAVARSVSSVSYKDVLGKTVEKPKRGMVSGTAASIAAAGVLIFGLLLVLSVFERTALVLGALTLASVLWFVAAFRFSHLTETPSKIDETATESVSRQYIRYLFEDQELQKFLVVRGLLTATAVAPPFLLLLATDTTNILNQLGALVIASSFATFLSGRVWGVLSDQSTRYVLTLAGLSGATFLTVAILATGERLFNTVWFLPSILCLFLVSYQGVRIGRSIHLVNLASEETRAAYTAISNTIIGVVLLGTGLFGVLAEATSVRLVLLILASMSLLGGLFALRLEPTLRKG
jgi:hypothetical protein